MQAFNYLREKQDEGKDALEKRRAMLHMKLKNKSIDEIDKDFEVSKRGSITMDKSLKSTEIEEEKS